MFTQFHLRTLTSVPSMPLAVKSKDGKTFTITLDSGATVSFMSRELCIRLGLEIRPNGQLATLADPNFSVKSVGEVDFVVTECTSGTALLRVRALVLEKLAVECYGGTTLHLDNHLVPDLAMSIIWAHGFRFAFKVPPHNRQAMPPPSITPLSALSLPRCLLRQCPNRSLLQPQQQPHQARLSQTSTQRGSQS